MSLHIPPCLWDEACAAELLRRYWGQHPDGSPRYTGSRFERLAGGGDKPSVANRFTADDVMAVSTLSVTIRARAALRLVEPAAEDCYSDLLEQLPTDVELVDADQDIIAKGGPAWQLWERLRETDDIGPVGAGKLLARKRPRLLPVYDSVIKRVFNRPHNDLTFWSDMRSALRADDQKLVNHLEAVRDLSGIGDDITVLRVLDTAAWLHGKDA
ncbi:DUF6308 family protein [Actinacidiphila soli]|uniref:DUF6308 family protein n=1 Tax=Actinacidiphila soli TaxID=2487275 RepID=UPI000FCC7810|nr:DUF6308 family protein [Actinacidiphila soli]